MKSQVSIVKCANYNPALVEEAVRKSVELIGGITKYIKPNSRVLIKPNMLMAKEPEFGIDTHPEVVRAAIKILKDINCQIFVGDGPCAFVKVLKDIDEVYQRSGMVKVCEEESVELVKFNKRRMRRKFPLTTWLDDCDYLINLPKFKTHEITLLTGGIKNLFGLVPESFKIELHKNYFSVQDFSNILVDIYAEARPALTIIDGITAMEGDGPGTSGKLRDLGLLLAGADCAALDSVMAKIIGIEPLDVLTNKIAAERGLGLADLNSIEMYGEKLNELKVRPFLLPSSSWLRSNVPKPVTKLIKSLIKHYPGSIQKNCTQCASCIKMCPNECITMRECGITFDYKKCIGCFCCQEACPAKAIKVKSSLLARILGL